MTRRERKTQWQAAKRSLDASKAKPRGKRRNKSIVSTRAAIEPLNEARASRGLKPRDHRFMKILSPEMRKRAPVVRMKNKPLSDEEYDRFQAYSRFNGFSQ